MVVSDPNEVVRKKLGAIAPEKIETVADNKTAALADIVFLAVHPPVIKDVLVEIKNELKPQAIFISLAPVVSCEKLQAMLGGFNRLVRMIPNAPSIIHQGYNPVFFASGITPAEKTQLMKLFQTWGQAPEVKEENLEAYAIVAAMGPTYFWPQWVQLQKLGKEFGLSDSELNKTMPIMLKSAVDTLYGSGLSAAEVMDLIPVYPLKDNEPEILNIFQTKLTGLYKKLTGK
jgi:pyrroline-5-carboxylate reductase